MGSRADIEAGKSFVRLFLKDDMTKDLQKSLKSVGKTLQSTGAMVAKVGAGVSAAGAAILGPLAAAVSHFVSVGDDLGDMSARTKVSAQSLAELGYAATLSGTDLEAVEKSLLKMRRTLGDAASGSKSARKDFADLGLSWAELQKLKPEDQFQAIADKLAGIDDPLSAATKIFGKGAAAIMPMLANLRKLREEARAEGIIPSEKAIEDASKLDDSFNKLKAVVSSLVFEIGSSLSEEVLALAEGMRSVIKTVRNWIKENSGLVKIAAAVGIALAVAGAAITAAGGVLIAAGLAASGLSVVVGALGTAFAFLASPIGLIGTALVAGIAIWARYTDSGKYAIDTLKAAFSEFLTLAQEVFGGIVDALSGGDLQLAGEIAFLGLQLAAMEGLAPLQTLFGDAMTGIVGRILQGDIAGAWSDTLSHLGLLWAAWSEMVVTTMTGMAESIVQVWQKVVTFIADKILEVASLPGFNKLFEFVSGVDLASEIERGKKLGVSDPLGDAKKVAGDQVKGQADAMIAKLDDINKAARAATDAAAIASNNATGSGIDSLFDSLAQKRDAFNRKRDAAAKLAASGKKGAAPGIDDDAAGAAIGATSKNLITVSAASAVAAGYMGSSGTPQQRMADDIKDMTKLTEKQLTAINQLVVVGQQIMTGLVYGA